MRWFWVKLHFSADGYYDDTSWQLIAAHSPEALADDYKQSQYKILDVFPYEQKPVPLKPRVTKHSRPFNPELRNP